MNWLFRRHFWLINLVFLCITAGILAKTFVTVLGYGVSKTIPEKPVGRVFVPREEGPAIKNFDFASERNLFAAKREQINIAEEVEEEVGPGRWQDAGPSSLPLRLISSMVFLDPFDSRATIVNVSSGATGIFSIADCEPYIKQNSPEIETVIPPESWEPERHCNDVFGLATVVRIQEDRVWIINNRSRRYEFLSLLEGDIGPYKEKPLAQVEGEVGAGVRKIGPTSYEIDQSEFDKAMANVAKLMTEARAVLETDAAGNQIGFKIAYIKEGSLLDKIGIERLDVLTRINGYELNSPEKALQLFGKLRSANQFTIDLKRGDRSVTLDYSVVR